MKPIFRNFSLTILVLIFLAYCIFQFSKQKYIISVLNESKSTIAINIVEVDGDVLYKGNLFLKSNNGEKYIYIRRDFPFDSHSSNILNISISSDARNVSKNLSCEILDQEKVGGIFIVRYKEDESITCVCESNADFK
jgi:hypothetical protein